MRIKSFLVGILASLSIGTANAALLIDWSPDTVGASVGCCVAQQGMIYFQHFQLSSPTSISGFAYYVENNNHIPAVGSDLFVEIVQGPFPSVNVWTPDPSEIFFSSVVPVASNQFPGSTGSNYGDYYGLTGIFGALPSIQLSAGEYLIGFTIPAFSGFALLSGPNAPFNDPMPQETLGMFTISQAGPPVGTMAMRLYGDVVTVPEPGTLALLAGALGMLTFTTRRRRSTSET